MSNRVDLVGYAAAVFSTLAFVPQVVKTWRSKSAGDLSVPTLGAFSTGVLLWLLYALALHSTPMIAANAITLALNAVLVVLKIRHGRRK